MPQPTDDAYPVEPPVSQWPDLTSGRPTSEATDEYALGEEVERAPYRIDANTWQEIVAAREVDEPYAVAPQIGQPPTRGARLLAKHAERLTQEQRAADQRNHGPDHAFTSIESRKTGIARSRSDLLKRGKAAS